MMWAFVALATVELLAVHLFLSLMWPWLAWPLTALSAASIVWFVLLIRSFKQRPHRLNDGNLRLSLGRLRHLNVPVDAIVAVRGPEDGAETRARDTAKFNLISYPNRVLILASPMQAWGREVRRVALALDDPAAFDLALQR